nr:unnamed protein product [Spirometra erinaceieuropaei]
MSPSGGETSGRAGDKDNPECRQVDRPSFRHLQDADSPTASQETSGKELAQRLASLKVGAAATNDDDENTTVENRWDQVRNTIQSTALAVLGRARRQHQDWFDDNEAAISILLTENRRLVQQRLRDMQDFWIDHKAEGIQGYVGHNEWKNFFSAIKAVSGLTAKGTASLLNADGTTLTEKARISNQCAENFRDIINRLSTISDAAIARLTQVGDQRRPRLTARSLSAKPLGSCRNSPAGKLQNQTRSLLRLTSTAVPDLWITRQRPSGGRGAKNMSLRILRMPQSSISTDGKGTAEFATTTKESHCSKSPE